jgi:hypothetical protein
MTASFVSVSSHAFFGARSIETLITNPGKKRFQAAHHHNPGLLFRVRVGGSFDVSKPYKTCTPLDAGLRIRIAYGLPRAPKGCGADITDRI